jgi:hypothetical protein
MQVHEPLKQASASRAQGDGAAARVQVEEGGALRQEGTEFDQISHSTRPAAPQLPQMPSDVKVLRCRSMDVL